MSKSKNWDDQIDELTTYKKENRMKDDQIRDMIRFQAEKLMHNLEPLAKGEFEVIHGTVEGPPREVVGMLVASHLKEVFMEATMFYQFGNITDFDYALENARKIARIH